MLFALSTENDKEKFSLSFDTRYQEDGHFSVTLFNNAQKNWATKNMNCSEFVIAQKDPLSYNIIGEWKKVRNAFRFYNKDGSEFNPEEAGNDLLTSILL